MSGRRAVFVFGSNRQGRHGAGAAREARLRHGAVYGRAEGLQGNSYAIVTKELRPGFPPVGLGEVAEGVRRFLAFAAANPERSFRVTPIGCGLAGFVPEQIAPMFAGATGNVSLPDVFLKVLARRNSEAAMKLFYDPHDGRSGAMIALPAPLLAAARAADGLTDDLDNVVLKFQAVADSLVAQDLFGHAKVEARPGYVALELTEGPAGTYPRHSWRLIRYRDAGSEPESI